MKRTLSLVLSLLMVFSVAVALFTIPASALTGTYQILSVNNCAADDVSILVRKGTKKTIGEVISATADYSNHKLIVVDANGIVTAVKSGDNKGKEQIPENGYILAVSNGQLPDFIETVAAGDTINIYGVDLKEFGTVANGTALTTSSFSLVHVHDYKVVVDNERGFIMEECTRCGKRERKFGGEIYDLAGEAPNDLTVSHVNAYSWGSFDSMILSTAGKTLKECCGYDCAWWIVYKIENQNGKLVATEYYANDGSSKADIVVPEGGFLWVTFSAYPSYQKALNGKLLGYTFWPDWDITKTMAVDTTKNPGGVQHLYAAAPVKFTWDKDSWTDAVIGSNAGWQNTSSAYLSTSPAAEKLTVKYQYRQDHDYLYVGMRYSTPLTKGTGNGNSTFLRIWFKTDTAQSAYSYFYNVWVNANGEIQTTANKNLANAYHGCNDSTAFTTAAEGNMISYYNNTAFAEIKIPLSELKKLNSQANVEEAPDYLAMFMTASIEKVTGRKDKDGKDQGGNQCIYMPALGKTHIAGGYKKDDPQWLDSNGNIGILLDTTFANGNLDEDFWKDAQWITVNNSNGTWQATNGNFSYKYATAISEGWLHVAAEVEDKVAGYYNIKTHMGYELADVAIIPNNSGADKSVGDLSATVQGAAKDYNAYKMFVVGANGKVTAIYTNTGRTNGKEGTDDAPYGKNDGRKDRVSIPNGGYAIAVNIYDNTYQDPNLEQTVTVAKDERALNMIANLKVGDTVELYGTTVADLAGKTDTALAGAYYCVHSANQLRFWIQSNPKSDLYTHFIDVLPDPNNANQGLKTNGSLTVNQGGNFDREKVNSAVKFADGKLVYEFAVKLADVGLKASAKASDVDHFICLAGAAGTLYYPIVLKSAAADNDIGVTGFSTFPWNNWIKAPAMNGLIPLTYDWTTVADGSGKITEVAYFNEALVVKNDKGWPTAKSEYSNALTYTIKDHKLSYSFKIVGGTGADVNLIFADQSGNKMLFPLGALRTEAKTDAGKLKPGTYEGEINLEKLVQNAAFDPAYIIDTTSLKFAGVQVDLAGNNAKVLLSTLAIGEYKSTDSGEFQILTAGGYADNDVTVLTRLASGEKTLGAVISKLLGSTQDYSDYGFIVVNNAGTIAGLYDGLSASKASVEIPDGGYAIGINGKLAESRIWGVFSRAQWGDAVVLTNVDLAYVKSLTTANVPLYNAYFTVNSVATIETANTYATTTSIWVPFKDGDTLLNTIGKITAKVNGAAKDLNYWNLIVVNKDNKIVGYYQKGSDKTNVEIPEGGYAIGAHADKVSTFGQIEDAHVGDSIELFNIDLANIAKQAKSLDLANASFKYTGEHDTENIVSIGKSYTYGNGRDIYTSANKGMVDDHKRLTDGVVDRHPSWAGGYSAWVKVDKDFDIIVDLGEEKDLSVLSVYNGKLASWGVQPIASVQFSLSSDGKTYREVGGVKLEEASLYRDDGNFQVYCYSLQLGVAGSYKPNYDTGRYVKYTFTGNQYIWITELEAYAYNGVKPTIYGDDVFWVTHYNSVSTTGAGAIMTKAYTGAGWWNHVAFAPVEGSDSIYKIVAMDLTGGSGTAKPLAVPEGGFVYVLHCGGDIKARKDTWDRMLTWQVGDYFKLDGVDFKNVPTTTPSLAITNVEYVCTATLTKVTGDHKVLHFADAHAGEDLSVITRTTLTDALGEKHNLTKIGEITRYICDEKVNPGLDFDYENYLVLTVDKDNIITAKYDQFESKGDIEIPEGGFVLAIGMNGSNRNVDYQKALADFYAVEVGDAVLLYDLKLAPYAAINLVGFNNEINYKGISFGEAPAIPEVPAVQPEELAELPSDAIVIDYAGYKHAGVVSIVAGDNQTVAELTARGNNGAAKDMNYAYNILVGKDNKVIDVDFTLAKACTFTCPEGGYIISYNGNKAGYDVMTGIKVGDKITVYNVIIDGVRALEGNVELQKAGFTYASSTEEKKPISYQKNYTTTENTRTDAHADDGKKLTDGKKSPDAGTGSYSGWSALEPEIVVDLEKEALLNKFVVHAAGGNWGITMIPGFTVEVSSDNVTFTKVNAASVKGAEAKSGDWASADFTIELEAPVKARYVKFIVSRENQFVWIDEVEAWEAPAFEKTVIVKENAILTDGKSGFDGNWGAVGTNDVLLVQNEKCATLPMRVFIIDEFDELKVIESVKLDLYHCAGVMIGYPEGKAIVSVSADGETYEQVGEFDLAAAELEIGKYGTVSSEFKFDAVEAKFVKVELNVGSSTAVLGDTPADGKVYWEFISIAEISVTEGKLPETEPEDYLWLSSENGVLPSVTFKVPADKFQSGPLTIKARVFFGDDCAQTGGCLYLNLYPYKGDQLLSWVDYAKYPDMSTGEWLDITVADHNPAKGEVEPDSLWFGIGYWNATGTVKVAYIHVLQDGKQVWGVDFTDESSLEGADTANITAENKNVNWGFGEKVEPEQPAVQPEEKEELPEGAIQIDFAGYKHAGVVSIVAGDNQTVAELTARGNDGTAKDMNYAYNILVDKDNKVIAVDFELSKACEFTCPEGGYIISYNGNKAGYEAMADIKVGATITVYNVLVDGVRALEGNVELEKAGFTYENPAEPFEQGDVNGDGEVDAVDYIMLRKTILGTYDASEEENARMDLNGDGEVDSIDYILLKKLVLQG